MSYHNDQASDETVKARVRDAAARAKAEAAGRRAKKDRLAKAASKEIDGRGGLDPVRYNDWEIKGLTSDF